MLFSSAGRKRKQFISLLYFCFVSSLCESTCVSAGKALLYSKPCEDIVLPCRGISVALSFQKCLINVSLFLQILCFSANAEIGFVLVCSDVPHTHDIRLRPRLDWMPFYLYLRYQIRFLQNLGGK